MSNNTVWEKGYTFAPAGSEEKRTALAYLPSVVERNGLEIEGQWKKGKGGKFHCPCCSETLGLYFDRNLGRNTINNFSGNCTHFGKNGEYPSDAIGIEMACRGLVANGENAHMVYDSLFGTSFSSWDAQKKFNDQYEKNRSRESEKTDRVQESNIKVLNGKLDFMVKSDFTGKLLAKRGIDEKDLSSSIREKIGTATGIYLDKADGSDKKQLWYGLVFCLGSPDEKGNYGSFQCRRTTDYHLTEFVTKPEKGKGSPRFFTCGPSKVFNEEELRMKTEYPLFVCEGSLDAISVLCLLNRTKHNMPTSAIGLNGVGNTSYLLDEIKAMDKSRVVYLVFDSDEAGKKGRDRLAEKLKEEGITVLPFPGNAGYKDANELLMKKPNKGKALFTILDGVGLACTKGLITPDHAKEIIAGLKTGTGSDFSKTMTELQSIFSKGKKHEKTK